METVYSVAGIIIMLLIAFACAAACAGWAWEIFTKWWDGKVRSAIHQRLRLIGLDMENGDYWFHEHRDAAMWLAIAAALRRGERPDPGRIRDQDFPQALIHVREKRAGYQVQA